MLLLPHGGQASCGSRVPRPQDSRAGSQGPLNGANTFLPGPTPRHLQALSLPSSLHTHCGEGILPSDQGPCPPAPFWPHSKAERGHMGSQHQAKAEGQLFAKLLIPASKPTTSGWEGGAGCPPCWPAVKRRSAFPSLLGEPGAGAQKGY